MLLMTFLTCQGRSSFSISLAQNCTLRVFFVIEPKHEFGKIIEFYQMAFKWFVAEQEKRTSLKLKMVESVNLPRPL